MQITISHSFSNDGFSFIRQLTKFCIVFNAVFSFNRSNSGDYFTKGSYAFILVKSKRIMSSKAALCIVIIKHLN